MGASPYAERQYAYRGQEFHFAPLRHEPGGGIESPQEKGGKMKPRTILTGLAILFVGAAACFAADPNIGTWKLNEAKSKIAPGAAKNTTVVYEAAGDMVKITVDGVDAAGKPVHHEWTGKYDGKDYPVTGDPTSDSRSYKAVGDRTLTFAAKKGGKVTTTGRIVVAADGKSRSLNTTTIDSNGKKLHSTSTYDKQ